MSAVSNTLKFALRPYRRKLVATAIGNGLPSHLAPALLYLADGKVTPRAASHIGKVEAVRRDLADRDGTIPIFYSPKPQSAGVSVDDLTRPPIGKKVAFTYRQIANHTSTSPRWGGFLYLVAEGSKAATVLELGACAGIAASFFAIAPQNPRVITVEASPELAALALESTSQVSSNVEVRNELFDDALDHLLPELGEVGIEVAWIDGHHESIATQHYFNRLKPALSPGSLVLFDDISWSQDMQNGWQAICKTRGVSHTVDLGKLGLAVWQGGDDLPQRHDLRLVAGLSRKIAQPSGWRDVS